MLVFDDFREVLEPYGFHLTDRAKFIGDVVDGKLKCLAAFDNYNGTDIDVHIVCDGMTRRWIRAIGDYVFNVCGCNRMTSLNDSENFQMEPYLERLGFRYEGRKRNALPDSDLLIYGLIREEWKWGRAERPT